MKTTRRHKKSQPSRKTKKRPSALSILAGNFMYMKAAEKLLFVSLFIGSLSMMIFAIALFINLYNHAEKLLPLIYMFLGVMGFFLLSYLISMPGIFPPFHTIAMIMINIIITTALLFSIHHYRRLPVGLTIFFSFYACGLLLMGLLLFALTTVLLGGYGSL